MPYRPTDITTLKGAYAVLLDKVGGLKRAATVSRVSESVLSRYCDPAEDKRHMPADVIASLETDCGAAVVTAFLAGMQDAVLTPMGKGAGDPSRDFARLAADFGRVCTGFGEALKDGRLTSDECKFLIARLDGLIEDAGCLRKDLIGELGLTVVDRVRK